MTPGEFSNELDWLAFCYVAEELDPAQRAAFESRLAEDQAACEAVVRAVELSCTVVRSGQDDADLKAGRRTRLTNAALLVAIAAMVSFCLASAWLFNPAESSKNPDAEVALAWAESVDVPELDSRLELTPAIWEGEWDDDVDFSRDDFEEQDEFVNWMFAALERDERLETGE
jgi:hypothetical protein